MFLSDTDRARIEQVRKNRARRAQEKAEHNVAEFSRADTIRALLVVFACCGLLFLTACISYS